MRISTTLVSFKHQSDLAYQRGFGFGFGSGYGYGCGVGFGHGFGHGFGDGSGFVYEDDFKEITR